MGFVPRGDGVIAPDPAVDSHGGEFSPALVLEHSAARRFGFPLRGMKTRRSVGVDAFVNPFAVGPSIDRSISVFAHDTILPSCTRTMPSGRCFRFRFAARLRPAGLFKQDGLAGYCGNFRIEMLVSMTRASLAGMSIFVDRLRRKRLGRSC